MDVANMFGEINEPWSFNHKILIILTTSCCAPITNPCELFLFCVRHKIASIATAAVVAAGSKRS